MLAELDRLTGKSVMAAQQSNLQGKPAELKMEDG